MGDAQSRVNPFAPFDAGAESKKAPPRGGALLAETEPAYFFSSFFISFFAAFAFLWWR
jgi:hypothetical protein